MLGAGGKVAPAALRALSDFPALGSDPRIQETIAAALASSEPDLLRAGVQLVLGREELRAMRPVARK